MGDGNDWLASIVQWGQDVSETIEDTGPKLSAGEMAALAVYWADRAGIDRAQLEPIADAIWFHRTHREDE